MTNTLEARGTRRETIIRLSLIGVFAAVTLAWLIAGVFEAPEQPDNYTNSYSGSPGGHHAFVALLRQNGRSVKTSATRPVLPQFDNLQGQTLMLLEPRPRFVSKFGKDVVDLLADAQRTHSSVIVTLPKREYDAARETDGGTVVLTESIYWLSEINSLLRHSGFERWFELARDDRPQVRVHGESPLSGRPQECMMHEPVQVLRPLIDVYDLPPNVQIIAYTDRDDAVAVRLRVDAKQERGGMIVISDPDLFSNRFLGGPGVADMAMMMLDSAPRYGEVVIDESLHGFGADVSLEYLAATPPGLWLSLSVLLALGMFAWRQGTVLRPVAAETPDRDERSFAIEGLARMMERAGKHLDAAARIIRRAEPVLGQGSVSVQEAGKGGTSVLRRRRSRGVRMPGATSAEQLVSVARQVAEKKRAGETGGAEVWSD